MTKREIKQMIKIAYRNKYKHNIMFLFRIKILYVNHNYTYVIFKYKNKTYLFKSFWYYRKIYCGEETIKLK